jgi:hypothetical protein
MSLLGKAAVAMWWNIRPEQRSEFGDWHFNDLRQTFRTIATAAGVSEIDAKLLMNHAMPGVNAGYITRHKLLHDHLRGQQQVISGAVFAALGTSLIESQYLQGWLGRGATQRVIQSAQVKPTDRDPEHVTIRRAA